MLDLLDACLEHSQTHLMVFLLCPMWHRRSSFDNMKVLEYCSLAGKCLFKFLKWSLRI